MTVIISEILVITLFGTVFKLPNTYQLILLGLSFILTPFFMHYQMRWKEEEQAFYELTDFLQQFLVSFKQHPKIYASLLESRPNTTGILREQVDCWINQLEIGVYPKESAQNFINKQSHFIVSNLIHLMLAVENYGTFNYIEGLEIIQNDIEDWIEDTTVFKNEQKSTKNRIQILALLACGIAWISHNMLFKTGLIETMNFYYFSLFVFLVLVLLTLFFSYKLISVPWIDASENLC